MVTFGVELRVYVVECNKCTEENFTSLRIFCLYVTDIICVTCGLILIESRRESRPSSRPETSADVVSTT